MDNRGRPSWAIVSLSFLYMWLMVGFILGTMVLVGPVRWVTSAVHRSGGGSGAENAFVIALVVVYVIFSAWLALRLSRQSWRSESNAVKFGIPIVATLFAVGTAIAWGNPQKMLSGVAGGGNIANVETANGAVFEFGPYPDSEKLAELQKHGVTTIISLQHPSVPVERPGIAEENSATKKLGLVLVRAPMLPWFSANREALDTIKKLALSGRGHYYVHCGLGRDRVNIVKSMIENLGAKSIASKDYSVGLGFEERQHPFTHGTLMHLAGGVWLTPYPEHEELYGCFLEGRAGDVVFIMDPADVEQKKRLDELTSIFTNYSRHFSVLPIHSGNKVEAAKAVDSVVKLRPPVTIVASETPWVDGLPRKGAENAFAFRDAFLARKAAVDSINKYWSSLPHAAATKGVEDVVAGC